MNSRRNVLFRLGAVGATFAVLMGCAPRQSFEFYLNRAPARVAVIPSDNKTQEPQAQIVLDKAWDKALHEKGYQVINSDQVITYAASRGILLRDLNAESCKMLAEDLHVDYLLTTDILVWNTQYQVVHSESKVSGVSRLTEGATEALVWEYHWKVERESQKRGRPLARVASSLATALIHSAIDELSRMAEHVIRSTSNTLPRPGLAPESPQAHEYE